MLNFSLQVAGYLGRGNPLCASTQMTLDAVPAPVSPGPGRNAEATHAKRALGSGVTARRDGNHSSDEVEHSSDKTA